MCSTVSAMQLAVVYFTYLHLITIKANAKLQIVHLWNVKVCSFPLLSFVVKQFNTSGIFSKSINLDFII
jgi:hypothetical protein